jgi:hypothetical protein
MDKEFTPIESIELIEKMINKAKNRFAENGFLYLLWGWVISLTSIAHFVLLKTKSLVHPEVIWTSCWATAIIQIFYIVKKKKKQNVRSYADETIGSIWIVFGICMGVSSFILGKADVGYLIYSIFLMLYGVPTFLCGSVMHFKPLKIGGVCCWILAIISTFVEYDYVLLLLSLAVIIAWLVPGYLLRSKYLNENKNL